MTKMMMNNLVKFTFHNIIIRTAHDDKGEPLFCANDLCAILGYSNPWDAVSRHVDSNYDLVKYEVIDELGRAQKTNFVTESGLYALIFGSKLETAKEFKRWVTSEVLPSIRKTGSYLIKQDTLSIERKLNAAKIILEPAGITGNQLTLALDKVYKANTGESLLSQAEIQLKATTQNQLYTPTELGKMLNISGQKFNSALTSLGYQTKVGKVWELTKLGRDQGGIYLDVGKKHSDGTPVRQLKWPMSLVSSVQQLLEKENE